MADQSKNGNGTADAAKAASQAPSIQVKIVTQYVKDISFENPNIRKLIVSPGDNPNVKIEVNVAGNQIEKDLYESAIQFKATASNNIGTLYVMETEYAGLLKVESLPEGALEPFLLISGPTILFPFLRRLVADITREGGFPPLMLEPIDFAGLYRMRQQELAAQANKTQA